MKTETKLEAVIKILLSNGDIDAITYAMFYQFIHSKFSNVGYENQYDECISKINDLHKNKKITTNDVIEFISVGTKITPDI